MSSSLSAVHRASLVDPSTRSRALLKLMRLRISRPLIEYVVDRAIEAAKHAMGRHSPQARGRTTTRDLRRSKFSALASNIFTQTDVTMPVILTSLVYIDRAKYHLGITQDSEWLFERLFLGALIVASKFLNDRSHNNAYWSQCTGIFGRRDIGRMEREFLDVLDWELIVTEDDILAHYAGISAVASPSTLPRSRAHPQHHNSEDASRRRDHLSPQPQSRNHCPIPLTTLDSECALPVSEELDTTSVFLFLLELDPLEVASPVSLSLSLSLSSSPSSSPSPRTPSPTLPSHPFSIFTVSPTSLKCPMYCESGLRDFNFSELLL